MLHDFIIDKLFRLTVNENTRIVDRLWGESALTVEFMAGFHNEVK